NAGVNASTSCPISPTAAHAANHAIPIRSARVASVRTIPRNNQHATHASVLTDSRQVRSRAKVPPPVSTSAVVTKSVKICTEAYLALQEQSPSCHAGHDASCSCEAHQVGHGIGLHTTFVQKLSLTYYTHNPLSLKASLAGEKS